MTEKQSLDSILDEYKTLSKKIETETRESENFEEKVRNMYEIVKERAMKLGNAINELVEEGLNVGSKFEVEDTNDIKRMVEEIKKFEKGIFLLRLNKYYENLSDETFEGYNYGKKVKYDTFHKNVIEYFENSNWEIKAPNDEKEIEDKLGFTFQASVAYSRAISNIVEQHYEKEKERGIDLRLIYGDHKKTAEELKARLHELVDNIDENMRIQLLERVSLLEDSLKIKSFKLSDINYERIISFAEKFGEELEEVYNRGRVIIDPNALVYDGARDRYENALNNFMNEPFSFSGLNYKGGKLTKGYFYNINMKYFGMAIVLIKKNVPENVIEEKILKNMIQIRKDEFKEAYNFAKEHESKFEINT